MSVAYSLGVPSYGVHHGPPIDGAWKGVYGHKNELGRACTFGIIIASLYKPDNLRMNAVRLATIFLSLLLVYLSQSKTNWLAIGAWLGFLPVLWFLRFQKVPKSIRLVIVILPAGLLIFLISQYSDLLLESVGRDSTMSGRTTLWRGVTAVTNDKFPLLGAGYGAFFTDNGGLAAIGDYIRYWSIRPNHAHNGYLNVFADLGWIGEIALVALILGAIYRTFYFLTEGKQVAQWTTAASFILMFLITNYSQSLSFKHSDLTWLMFCIVYLYGAVESRQNRSFTVRGVPLIANRRTALLS